MPWVETVLARYYVGELPFILNRDLAKAQRLEVGSELVPVGEP